MDDAQVINKKEKKHAGLQTTLEERKVLIEGAKRNFQVLKKNCG
jgi:hypothetical protein